MEESKLISQLRLLQPHEFRKLGKMARSPFFTQNPHLLALYQYLKPDYPDFNNPRLDKPKVFRKIFPGHQYSDIKMRNLMRDLSSLVEELLVFNALQNEASLKKKLITDEYLNRKKEQLFHTELKQLRKGIENSPYRDAKYFYTQYQLNQLELDALQSTNLKKRMELLDHSIGSLSNFHELSAIKLETEKLAFSSFYSQHPEPYHDIRGNIIYQIYAQTKTLYQTENLELLTAIKDKIIRHQNEIRKPQQLELLLFLINFGVGKMREDDLLYNDMVFDLYQTGMENQIIAWDGTISDTTFLNIVVTGAKAGQSDWVKTFLKNYAELLAGQARIDVTALAYIYFYFHQKNFLGVIQLLGQHHFTNLLQHIGARVYALRAYYELSLSDHSYQDFLFDKIHAFERFIRRNNKLSEEKQKAYLNFTAFLRTLAHQRSAGPLGKAAQSKLKRRLHNQQVTISRSWLLKKIES